MFKSAFTFQLHYKTVPSIQHDLLQSLALLFLLWLKLLNAFVDKGRHLRCLFCSNDVKLHPNCHHVLSNPCGTVCARVTFVCMECSHFVMTVGAAAVDARTGFVSRPHGQPPGAQALPSLESL